MSISTDLQERMTDITSIGLNEIKPLNMPAMDFVQEAVDLAKWSAEDMAKLAAAGLREDASAELEIRAGILKEAQSTWNTVLDVRDAAQEAWKIELPAAELLRKKILVAMRYAYRKQPEILERVSAISQGDTNNDLVQDLNDVAVLGRRNITALEAINFDPQELDLAAEKSARMSDLLANSNGEKLKFNDDKLIRDKAYIYLKDLVDEVRECGKYVFWDNPQRYRGYISRYRRDHR